MVRSQCSSTGQDFLIHANKPEYLLVLDPSKFVRARGNDSVVGEQGGEYASLHVRELGGDGAQYYVPCPGSVPSSDLAGPSITDLS